MEEKSKKDVIIENYINIVQNKKKIPVYSDFIEYEITKDQIKHHFGNINQLHKKISQDYSDVISENILTEDTVFTVRALEDLNENIKKYNRFIVTTVVSSKEVFKDGLECIKNYCNVNNAKLLLIPCQDVASRRETMQWEFDPILKNETFVFKDTKLNSNLWISSIKLSAKQINPTTGLARVGQRNGSYVFASPKQSLEFVVNSLEEKTIPAAIMTPGAMTKPNYDNDRYMSERTSYIAENDHVMGGIIIEIQDENIFHFRQFQFSHDGSFIDLGRKYTQTQVKEVKSTLVMGDYHAGETDEKVKSATEEICGYANVQDIVLHDFFDGKSINHYDDDKPLAKVKKNMVNKDSLLNELLLGGEELNWLHTIIPGKLYRVKSNHDDRIEKYLMQGKYINDHVNHYISLDLARALLDGEDVHAYAYLKYANIKKPKRIVWLDRDEDFKIGGVQLGAHGDLGINGSKGSMSGAERSYGSCIIGHAHTAAIWRNVFRVGTSTKLRLDYTKGATSWTHTHALIYDNGARQLINILEGVWKL